jgi:hypothetical protein
VTGARRSTSTPASTPSGCSCPTGRSRSAQRPAPCRPPRPGRGARLPRGPRRPRDAAHRLPQGGRPPQLPARVGRAGRARGALVVHRQRRARRFEARGDADRHERGTDRAHRDRRPAARLWDRTVRPWPRRRPRRCPLLGRRRRLRQLRPGPALRAPAGRQPRRARRARPVLRRARGRGRVRPPAAHDPIIAPAAPTTRRSRARTGRSSTPPSSACGPAARRPRRSRRAPTEFSANFTPEGFKDAVRRAVEYVHAGDVFQVVPSQRLSADLGVHPFAVYRALRTRQPEPLPRLPRPGTGHARGEQPREPGALRRRHVETCPIAGTRPRGATPARTTRSPPSCSPTRRSAPST